ncbi:hypothetical protein H2203_003174 [Taxawa tesnikishii (nom. ined.)]|nr:hypothetical protein H2203_003174 [Dothideales sp. JES 119]
MSAPLPKESLKGHCSVIDNNTLYVLSPDSFQALPLRENATWSSLPTGEPVTGPSCVRAVLNGDESQAALYVVGGSTDNENYQGLQRYFFANQTWETLTVPTWDMQGRTDHGTAYLNDSSSILVYAGSTPVAQSDTSSQTFLIQALPPYNIQSFTSKAPPLNQPILLPWDSTRAVMLGGDPNNKAIYTFGPQEGFVRIETDLSHGLKSGVKATLIQGDDGSKVLETYDMSASPNSVSQIVLLDAGGKTAPTGQILMQASSSRKRKRDLTLQNWPKYNDSLAPSVTRSDFGVAQNSNGLAVISGGNDDIPVSLFDQRKNAWYPQRKAPHHRYLRPLHLLRQALRRPPNPLRGSSKSHMLKVLGITLGVLCGIAAMFILALLFLRWRKQRQKRNQKYADEKADRMSFVDRGASFMKEAGGPLTTTDLPPPTRRPFNRATFNDSSNSFAIIAGKIGDKKRHSRYANQKGSFDSTAPMVYNKRKSNLDNGPPVELEALGEKKNGVIEHIKPIARDEHAPLLPPSTIKNLSSPDQSGVQVAHATSRRTSDASASRYTESRVPSMPSRIPSSALVPPLDIDFSKGPTFQGHLDGRPISRVATGSPSFGHSTEDLARHGSNVDTVGQSAQIHDRNHESMLSDYTTTSTRTQSAFSTDFTTSDYLHGDESTASAWTPVSVGSAEVVDATTYNPRPPSSHYTTSLHESRVPRGTSSAFFHSKGETYRPTSRTKARSPASPNFSTPLSPPLPTFAEAAEGRDSIESNVTVFPRGVPSMSAYPHGPADDFTASLPKPKPAFAQAAGDAENSAADRDSTVTVFPRGVPSMSVYPHGATPSPESLSDLPKPAPAFARSGNSEPRQYSHPFPRGVPSGVYPKNLDLQQPTQGTPINPSNSGRLAPMSPPKPVRPPRPSELVPLPVPAYSGSGGANAVGRSSTATMFPRGVPSAYYPKNGQGGQMQRSVVNEDMSWLNLGLGNRI